MRISDWSSDVCSSDLPFFEDRHRRLAAELEAWCASELAAHPHDETDIDTACRRLVTALAAGGWLRYVAPAAYGGIFDELDIRSVCIIRHIIASYSGLADFAFALQGLGSGKIGRASWRERRFTCVYLWGVVFA